MIDCKKNKIQFANTQRFSKIVLDYLENKTILQEFYDFVPNFQGIEEAIQYRKNKSINRKILAEVLRNQYQEITSCQAVQDNINLLEKPNTFTITTAHQPNIFTGYLYFFYKILHTIQLTKTLKEKYPTDNFVPVYYMGSEDADLDELGKIRIIDQQLVWKTKQVGAVGRMKIDESFLSLLHSIEGTIGVLPFGQELVSIFKKAYQKDKTIQQATFELVNELVGGYGLLILIPDNSILKQQLIPVFIKEIKENFSAKALQTTIENYEKHYPIQTYGRSINLFYLLNDIRERIEWDGNYYKITNTDLKFTVEELLQELNNYPERFSPNVILRGIFQETILPNIAFIGGGGELAYWLELKEVFHSLDLKLPVLLLRNSFLLIEQKVQQKIKSLPFLLEDYFKKENQLIQDYIDLLKLVDLDLTEPFALLDSKINLLKQKVQNIDPTLIEHLSAIHKQFYNKIISVRKKMIRAVKRKEHDQIKKIHFIYNSFFPNNNLQEREINFMYYYAKYGKHFFELILSNSNNLKAHFEIIQL